MLYFLKNISVETIVSSMKRLLADLWSTDSEVTWTVFQEKLIAEMQDSDDLSTQSYFVMMRENSITLVEWTSNLVTTYALAAQKAGTKVSNILASKLWAGKVTNDEWIGTKVTKPTTNFQRSVSVLSTLSKIFRKIDPNIF